MQQPQASDRLDFVPSRGSASGKRPDCSGLL